MLAFAFWSAAMLIVAQTPQALPPAQSSAPTVGQQAPLPAPPVAAVGTARLLTFKKVHVVPMDSLAVDVPIAKCFARHLPETLPLEAVASKEEADAVFKVSGNLPSATTRVLVGMFGGTPSAHLWVEMPDGAKVWDDGAKLRRAIGKTGKLDSADGDKTIECGLADELMIRLRDAMKKARDGRK